jgi:hypothetical protein
VGPGRVGLFIGRWPEQAACHCCSVVVTLEWCLALPSAVVAVNSSCENDSGARIVIGSGGMGAGLGLCLEKTSFDGGGSVHVFMTWV